MKTPKVLTKLLKARMETHMLEDKYRSNTQVRNQTVAKLKEVLTVTAVTRLTATVYSVETSASVQQKTQ